jgi:predicted transcriptional regulator
VIVGRSAGQLQQELFAAPGRSGAEPVLMALKPEFYELIWQGLKTHEFRRRFLRERPSRWFVYLTAPVSRLTALIDLAAAITGIPEQIATIAEAARPGNGASVLAYVRDLDQAFAIPILNVREYPGVPASELRAELGVFHPPQGYVRLAQHRALLAVCERMASGDPVRELTVRPRE